MPVVGGEAQREIGGAVALAFVHLGPLVAVAAVSHVAPVIHGAGDEAHVTVVVDQESALLDRRGGHGDHPAVVYIQLGQVGVLDRALHQDGAVILRGQADDPVVAAVGDVDALGAIDVGGVHVTLGGLEVETPGLEGDVEQQAFVVGPPHLAEMPVGTVVPLADHALVSHPQHGQHGAVLVRHGHGHVLAVRGQADGSELRVLEEIPDRHFARQGRRPDDEHDQQQQSPWQSHFLTPLAWSNEDAAADPSLSPPSAQ